MFITSLFDDILYQVRNEGSLKAEEAILWFLAQNIVINYYYYQSKCIEKYQFQLCSKYDREHDFDVILSRVVPCRKLR